MLLFPERFYSMYRSRHLMFTVVAAAAAVAAFAASAALYEVRV